MDSFRFATPIFFAFLLVPPAIALAPALKRRNSAHHSLVYSDTRLFAHLPQSWRIRLRRLPDVLKLLAWCLLVVAFARPQSGQSVEIIRGQGIDIALVLDISSSMAALDFEPQNRLETAKVVIADFINSREFDRIGLIVFARSAYHQSPLTFDYETLIQQLGQVRLVSQLRQIEGEGLDGTAVGLGIASATNMLRKQDTASKVIILLTDGDTNTGLSPIEATAAAQAYGIRIYTIGMGTTGLVDVPDNAGNIVRIESDLNENALQAIAENGDGLYFRAQDTDGLQRIYDRIDLLETSDAEQQVIVRWQDRAFLLLPWALCLLVCEGVLRRTLFQPIP